MPTPFYHLSIAEDLLRAASLSGEIRHFLSANRPAFLLGSTAPDVQTVSGQSREATHFFDLPIQRNASFPWDSMLAAYPALAYAQSLPVAQAAFVAGYLCHLLADWLWIEEIFAPVFGPDCHWNSFGQRLYYHNVLRSYLDLCILPGLPGEVGQSLATAAPVSWLPFVQDQHLQKWRDFLASQLLPGAVGKTVEVFAARQGISPEAYYGLIKSEERMDQEVFTHLPRQKLTSYRNRLLGESERLLKTYLTQPFITRSYTPVAVISAGGPC